uniref:Uncharacterized protein n=1 Tax=Anguilla anguilla TaxID=7936 RepID=A0A0E9V618_ANGAN
MGRFFLCYNLRQAKDVCIRPLLHFWVAVESRKA